MPLFIRKRKASREPQHSLDKKRSRVFGTRSSKLVVIPTSTSPPTRSILDTPGPAFAKLRRRTSQLFSRLSPFHASVERSMMDGTCSPRHRTASPSPSVLASPVTVAAVVLPDPFTTPPARGGKLPELDHAPQRKRSVRFLGVSSSQLDGQDSERSDDTPTNGPHPREPSGSHESTSSRHHQTMAGKIEALTAKLSMTNGTQTVVHRVSSRSKQHMVYVDGNIEIPSTRAGAESAVSRSTASSLSPQGRDAWATWSPAGTASTTATSLTSAGSSGARLRRYNLEERQTNSSRTGTGHADDHLLTPIEEDSGRYLLIPVQEAEIEAVPSIATVENAAIAKCALEQHFYGLLMEPSSPRVLRYKRFEQRLCDAALPHDERLEARARWARSESDHLRQMRVLKATSLARQNVKGVSIAGFNVLRVLGKGSFGVVRLVNERSVETGRSDSEETHDQDEAATLDDSIGTATTSGFDGTAKCNLPRGKPLKDVFAMKVIRKSEMIRSCQEGHLRAERDFLVSAESSRWVVPLMASFQDNTNLYLVMEYMIGGDFLGLLLREDVLEESVAQ